MSRPFRMAALWATTCLIALPVTAQDRAAVEAWETLRITLEEAGLQVTTGGSGADGAALLLREVVVRPSAAPMAMVLRMPTLTIAANPDGSFRATPSELLDLDLRDGRQRLTRLQIAHTGSLELALSEVGASLGLDFPSLRVTQTPGAGGKPVPGGTSLQGLDIGFEALRGQLQMTIGTTIGLSAQLVAARLAYDLVMNQTQPTNLSQTSSTELFDLTLDLDAREIPMDSTGPGFLATAFANGFGARLSLTTGAAVGSALQDFGGMQVQLTSGNDTSELELALEDGALSASMRADGVTIQAATPFLSSDGALASISIEAEMPLIADTADRPFRFALGITELRLGQALWMMAGAPGFADDRLTVALDVQGNGRWLRELDQIEASDAQPLDVSAMVLNDATVRFGTASLVGTGQFDLAPGALEAMDDGPPDGNGQFSFELRGADALLQRLSQTPLLPADQAFMVRAMIGALARPVGEDHVASDVVINPGGEILVNGQPLPF